MPDTLSSLIKIVATAADKDPATITSASTFEADLGLDSLAVVELILQIEEEFKVSVPDAKAHEFKTIGDVVAFLGNA